MKRSRRESRRLKAGATREQRKEAINKANPRTKAPKVDKELKDKINTIKNYNSSMRNLIKTLGANAEEKKALLKQNKELVPSTDNLTKSGYISTAKNKVSSLSPLNIKAIAQNTKDTFSEMKGPAKERLEKAGYKANLDEIKAEVLSELLVSQDIDSIIAKWYDYTSDPSNALETYTNPEISKLENELRQKGVKTYAELRFWMQDAMKFIGGGN